MTNVLIVDDSRFLRRTISDILSEAGIAYSEAANGQEALEMLGSLDVNCVVIDLMMPEMDGFEFLERYTGTDGAVPVVVLTADIQATTRDKCLEAGAHGVVNKPAEKESLLAAISAAVGD